MTGCSWVSRSALSLALMATLVLPLAPAAEALHDPNADGPATVSGVVSVPVGHTADGGYARARATVSGVNKEVGAAALASDGSYSLAGLPAGTGITICFSVPGLASECYDNAGIEAKATPITLSPGQMRSGIDTALTDDAVIRGTVSAPSGHELGWIQVWAWPVDRYAKETAMVSANPLPDGTYEIAGLRPGSYRLQFLTWGTYDPTLHAEVPSTLVGQWYSGQVLQTTAAVLDVEAGTLLTVDNVELWARHTFSDVPPGSGFFDEITWMGSNGISTGYDGNIYHPYGDVSRAAMAAFLYRLSGQPAFVPPVISPFKDVTPADQFYKEITWLSSTGITTGFPDGTFQPSWSVNRAAMAAFMHRLAGKPPTTTSTGFNDVPAGHQFAGEISWMRSSGISTGYQYEFGNYYQPQSPVQRAAMAAFMSRFATLKNDTRYW